MIWLCNKAFFFKPQEEQKERKIGGEIILSYKIKQSTELLKEDAYEKYPINNKTPVTALSPATNPPHDWRLREEQAASHLPLLLNHCTVLTGEATLRKINHTKQITQL